MNTAFYFFNISGVLLIALSVVCICGNSFHEKSASETPLWDLHMESIDALVVQHL